MCKGSFTVSSATNTVNMVLRFHMGSWFRNPLYRSLLDPIDIVERASDDEQSDPNVF